MSAFADFGTTVFILVLFAAIYMTLLGLPGTVVIFLDVLIYAALTGFGRIGFKIILLLLILSIIAEAIDFLIDMAGALKIMPTKKMLTAAAVGAIAVAFILTPVFGAPGTFGGFSLGCLAGILGLEAIRQSKLQAPFRASSRAVLSTIGGKMVKGFIALTMIAFSLTNIYS